MKNLPKEKRDRLILIAIGTLTVVVALWYGVINSQKKALAALAQRTEEQQNHVNNAERLVNSTAEIQKNLETTTQQLGRLEEGMASGDMYSWLILTMNKFRAGYNVEIPQFSREITGEVGLLPHFPYRAATFHIRGTAYFHDFGKFLADFENAFPFTRVQNLELEPVSSSSANNVGNASRTAAVSSEESEKLAFKLEIVTLINPTSAR